MQVLCLFRQLGPFRIVSFATLLTMLLLTTYAQAQFETSMIVYQQGLIFQDQVVNLDRREGMMQIWKLRRPYTQHLSVDPVPKVSITPSGIEVLNEGEPQTNSNLPRRYVVSRNQTYIVNMADFYRDRIRQQPGRLGFFRRLFGPKTLSMGWQGGDLATFISELKAHLGKQEVAFVVREDGEVFRGYGKVVSIDQNFVVWLSVGKPEFGEEVRNLMVPLSDIAPLLNYRPYGQPTRNEAKLPNVWVPLNEAVLDEAILSNLERRLVDLDVPRRSTNSGGAMVRGQVDAYFVDGGLRVRLTGKKRSLNAIYLDVPPHLAKILIEDEPASMAICAEILN